MALGHHRAVAQVVREDPARARPRPRQGADPRRPAFGDEVAAQQARGGAVAGGVLPQRHAGGQHSDTPRRPRGQRQRRHEADTNRWGARLNPHIFRSH